MAQAQFGVPKMETEIVVCDACNVVCDFFERVPKLLYCGHHFCLMCLRSMKKVKILTGEFILCVTCGYTTPAPRDLAWLPTHTKAAWRNPDIKRQPIVLGLDEPRSILGRNPIWAPRNDLAQDQLHSTNGNAFGSKGIAQGRNPSVNGIGKARQYNRNINHAYQTPTFGSQGIAQGLTSWSHPSLNGKGSAHQANGSINHAGISSVPMGSATAADGAHHRNENGVRTLFTPSPMSSLWDGPASNGDGSNEDHSGPFHRECQDWNLSNDTSPLPKRQSDDNIQFRINDDCPSPHLLNGSPWTLQTSHSMTPPADNERAMKVNRVKEALEDSVKILNIAKSNSIETQTECRLYDLNGNITTFSKLLSGWAFADIPPQTESSRSVAGVQTPTESSRESKETLKREDIANPDRPESKKAPMPYCISHRDVPESKAVGLNDIANPDRQEAKALVPYGISHRVRPESKALVPCDPLPLNLSIGELTNIYYMDFKIAERPAGRVVVETFPNLAPFMSANFAVLCLGTRGTSYNGCTVFQTWRGQSIISGDTETNTGNRGRSLLGNEFFEPDRNSLPPVRGMIGMRRLARTPKLHRGKVTSQFRILLNRQPKITALFGRVISGIEVVDRISQLDDGNGSPREMVFISDCGEMRNF